MYSEGYFRKRLNNHTVSSHQVARHRHGNSHWAVIIKLSYYYVLPSSRTARPILLDYPFPMFPGSFLSRPFPHIHCFPPCPSPLLVSTCSQSTILIPPTWPRVQGEIRFCSTLALALFPSSVRVIKHVEIKCHCRLRLRCVSERVFARGEVEMRMGEREGDEGESEAVAL
jgi:hypothetical protein